MRKSWFERLFPGKSDWIEEAARAGIDAYGREHDGVPRVETGEANVESARIDRGEQILPKRRTPSFA